MFNVLSLGLSLFLSFNTATSLLSTNNSRIITGESTVSAESEINTNDTELDNYLIQANYPEYFINSLDREQKLTIYNDKLTCEGVETVYGIFTEDVQIPVVKSSSGAYTLKNVTDKSKLDTLLKDTKTVEKILTANNSNIELQNNSSLNLLDSNPEISIAALTNWTSSVASGTPSYSSNGKVRVYLSYAWTWNYDPNVTLEDVMAMSWSDDWDCEPSTVYYFYGVEGAHAKYGSNNKYDSGYKYTKYSPGTGAGTEFNIISSWNKKNSDGILVTYSSKRHWGSLSMYISKYKANSGRSEQTSVVGQYFHETLSSNPTITFSYPPGISVAPTLWFKPSIESGKTFSWSN